MRIVTLVGTVDKRILVYPIARALSFENNVAILTDNGIYRNLFTEKAHESMLGRVNIKVSLCDDSIVEKINEIGIGYEYLLVDSSFDIPTNSDYIIYCRGVNKSFYPEDIIQVIEEKPHCEVVISPEPPEGKGTLAIKVDEGVCSYLYGVEESKQFKMFKSKALNKVLAKIFAPALNMNEASLLELLMRKDGVAYKK